MIRNKVFLIGRLTTNPELRYTKTETPVCNVDLAVNDFHNNNEVDYFHLVFWKNRALNLCEYKEKGEIIAVTGYLKTRSYIDKNNSVRNIVEVIVEEVDYLGKINKHTEEPMPNLEPGYKTQEEWEMINAATANIDDLPF